VVKPPDLTVPNMRRQAILLAGGPNEWTYERISEIGSMLHTAMGFNARVASLSRQLPPLLLYDLVPAAPPLKAAHVNGFRYSRRETT